MPVSSDPLRARGLIKITLVIQLKLVHCTQCGCLVGEDPCLFCEEPRTQAGSICVVASPRDAFAIESTHEYKGLYHVLGNLLSPNGRNWTGTA